MLLTVHLIILSFLRLDHSFAQNHVSHVVLIGLNHFCMYSDACIIFPNKAIQQCNISAHYSSSFFPFTKLAHIIYIYIHEKETKLNYTITLLSFCLLWFFSLSVHSPYIRWDGKDACKIWWIMIWLFTVDLEKKK